MSDTNPAENASLDDLAAVIEARGWVFELVAMGITFESEPVARMTAAVYIGRIYTPDGDFEWWDDSPHAALASALAETMRRTGTTL